jgi:hypothetical protein
MKVNVTDYALILCNDYALVTHLSEVLNITLQTENNKLVAAVYKYATEN